MLGVIMKKYTINIIIACLLFAACDMKPSKNDRMSIEDSTTSSINIVYSSIAPTLDTIILLSGSAKSNYIGANLTSVNAKKILYSYFKLKGYYTADNLPDMGKLTDSDNDKLSVDYDTIFTVDLNGNKNIDAIITYWLTPPYASGHCWQPHKAIVIDNDKGYNITNEEFIPDNFAIDSVVTKDHSVIIYGYDYDCGNHKVLRNLRVKIK